MSIVGVRFNNIGKIIYYKTEDVFYERGEKVVAETNRGIELGEVVHPNRKARDEEVSSKPISRKATPEDVSRDEKNRRIADEAFSICENKIIEHKLKMKLIYVDYTLDASKILFYFTAEGRVDFRELVKSLASIFHTRIELRQIGARDEAKKLGGIGVCGRILCCKTFLDEFAVVTIKMAKEQSLSLNPTKISGTCGRLMCCLKYEQDTYDALLRNIPKIGTAVKTPEGRGVIVENNAISGTVKVQMDKDVPNIYHTYKLRDVVVLEDKKYDKGDELAEPKTDGLNVTNDIEELD